MTDLWPSILAGGIAGIIGGAGSKALVSGIAYGYRALKRGPIEWTYYRSTTGEFSRITRRRRRKVFNVMIAVTQPSGLGSPLQLLESGGVNRGQSLELPARVPVGGYLNVSWIDRDRRDANVKVIDGVDEYEIVARK